MHTLDQNVRRDYKCDLGFGGCGFDRNEELPRKILVVVGPGHLSNVDLAFQGCCTS